MVPPGHRRGLGRRRPGVRRPRRRRWQGAVRRGPDPAVAEEAAEWGADLLVVHHPLFLKPVHGFAATTPKGRTLATLAKAGCALLTAHTNADQADGGVSEALATALGLTDLAPIVPLPDEPMDKLVVYVPEDAAAPLRAAIAEAGAGAIGNYDHCTFTSPGQGRFRPLEGADPAIGTVGSVEVVDEAPDRVRAAAPRRARPWSPRCGRAPLRGAGVRRHRAGRPGHLRPRHRPDRDRRGDHAGGVRAPRSPPPCPRPRTASGSPGRRRAPYAGSRCAGERGTSCSTGWPASDVDVYLTSDLRHHPAAEFAEKGGPALVDVAHWAAEWTWLPVVQARLAEALGATVESRVSTIATDPWTFRV